MRQDEIPQKEEPGPGDYRVNFFRPRPGFMEKKVRYTWILLSSWLCLTLGFPLLLRLVQRNERGESLLTDAELFGFPFHYWFSGQFLILWFILLCYLFNLFVDRLTKRYRKSR